MRIGERSVAVAFKTTKLTSMSDGENQPKSQVQVAKRPDGSSLISQLPPRSSIIIGRGADCEVQLKDVKASRHHCKLTRENDGFRLEDLGSRNGTFVEGVRIDQPVFLKPHQAFKIGDTVFYLA